VRQAADHVYEQLVSAGVDAILDDRGERPGAMFADWELIGVPHRITVGERGLKEGKIEHVDRRALQTTLVPLGDMLPFIRGRLAA
jgi:prolyl-tRNA synthetase